jgi:sec-independent protein translocase protein TatA
MLINNLILLLHFYILICTFGFLKIIIMNLHLFIFGQGPWEVVLIFGAVLLLFGGKKIPELMRGIGKGIREFNSARSTLETELKEGTKEAERARLEENK